MITKKDFCHYLLILSLAGFISVGKPLTTNADFYTDNVNKESTVVQRGSGGFYMELDTAAVFGIAVTTDVPVTVKLYIRYNSSYNTGAGLPTVNIYGHGINSTATVSVGADQWEFITLSSTPTSEGVINLTIRSYSSAANTKVYFDELVAISTQVDTGTGDYFTDETEEESGDPSPTIYDALLTPRLYTGSGDFFVWDSSGAPAMILQKYYETPLLSTGTLATAVSTSSIIWSWHDTSYGAKDEDEFRIISSTGGLLGVVSAGGTYWTETGLSPNTTYYRLIRSWNVVGSSDTAQFAGVTLAEARPVDSLTALSGSSIRINFSGGANPSNTLYAIKAIVGGATYYVNSANSQLNTTPDYQPLAIWGTPRDISGLSGNTLYTFSIIAKNWAGIENEGSQSARSTLANKPVAQPFNDYFISTYSIRCYWDANGNGAGTTYRVQMSTTNDFSIISATMTTNSGTYLDFTGLSANKGYYFRVCALNLENDPTAYENLTPSGAKYTRIESAVLSPSELSVFTTSATINLSAQTFSNLSDGSSGIQFEETGSEGSPWVSGWEKNKIWTRRADNPTSSPSLTPNTTYQFRVRTQNIQALANDWTAPITRATKIESITANDITFEIYSSSIGIKANGAFTNLESGQSGINYTICVNTYQWTNTGVSSSTWVKTTDYWWFTEYTGLGDSITPNTTYYFIANTRNYDGVTNGTTTIITKVSGAVTPVSPEVGLPLASPYNRLGINILSETPANSSDVEYAISVSSDTGGIASYVQSDRTLGVAAVWRTKSSWNSDLWGDGSDKGVTGLLWNTTYYIKVKARNYQGVETVWSPLVSTVTYATAPYNISLSTAAGELGRLDAIWSGGSSTGYQVQITSHSTGDFSTYISSDSGVIALTSHTFTNLLINTKYYIRVRSFNSNGYPTPWITEGDKYNWTISAIPEGVNIRYDIGYSSLTVVWSNGANPSGTATKYIVQVSSSATFDWVTSEEGSPYGSTFEPALEYKFTIGLSKNTRYWVRVRSVSGDATVGRYYSNWQTAGSSCTLIDTPTGIDVTNITQTNVSLSVKWDSQFDLSDAGGDGSRWLLNKENDSNTYNSVETGGQDTWWRDGSSGTSQDIFGGSNGALTPNTTNQFSVKVRNKDRVETAWVSSVPICTRIESPTGVTLVEASTWYVRAKPSGSFTNLGQGATVSAIVVWKEGEAEPDDLEPVGSKWKASTSDYREFTGNPDQEIILYTKARNKYGVSSYYGTSNNPTPATYYTLAETPSVPVLSGATTGSIRININTGGNPGVTVYAVKVTTSGGINRYLSSDGSLGGVEVWQTESVWEGTDGYKTLWGLTPNTSYYISVAARNRAGVSTGYQNTIIGWTAIESVGSIQAIETSSSNVKVQVIPGNGIKFTNLGSGQSHIRVSTDTVGFPESGYQVLTDTTVYTFSGRTPNTEQTIYARSYNGENNGAGSNISITTATRIEPAEGVEFGTITNSIIEARAKGTFSNLTGNGQSGVIVYKLSPAPAEDSGWQANTNFWSFSGLLANTTYYFKANSRNMLGVANAETVIFSTVTRANTPSAPTISIVSTDTLNVVINENNNPPGTEYRILVSSTDWSITKYVQGNGSLGDTPLWRTKTDWGQDSGKDVTGLTPNTQYKFKVTARNSAGTPTAESAESARYTKIQSPEGISYNLYETSVSVTASGTMTNVEQLGWIQFGYTQDGLNWTDTADRNGTGVQTYLWSGLLANTTYTFRVRTKNATRDAVNEYFVDQSTSTRIEGVASCHLTVNSPTQLSAVPSNANLMSNLSIGYSGWLIKIKDGVTDEVSYSDWRNDTVAISTGGLKPNRLYYFSGKSRNRLGLENNWSIETSTYTYASAPSSPVVQAVAGYDDRLKVIIDNFATNENPDITQYRIEIRRTDQGDWATNTKYVIEDGSNFIITDYESSATYKTRAQWGGDSGFIISGLSSNVEYAIRLRARNYYGHLSGDGSQTLKKTLPGRPANVTVAPVSGYETSRISISWDSNAYQYRVQYATSSYGVWSDVFTAWDLTQNSTIHYNLTPSTCVFYRVKARNTDLSETDWSDVASTWTWASTPGISYLLSPTTYSIKVEWVTSGNPTPPTSWFVEVSIDSQTFSDASSSGWISSTYTVIEGLNQNNKYYARVKARNPVGVTTPWGDVSGYKYTLIADCTDIVLVDFGTNWIKMKAVPEPVNLGQSYNSTGIDFKNLVIGTSSQWIQTNLWTDNTELVTNSEYGYKVRIRNGDGIEGAGSWQPSSGRTLATAMESPTGVNILTISSYSVTAQVSPNSGYSNINSGASGLVIECHSKPDYTSFISSTGWSKTENLTGNFNGLNANTTYYFRARSRNRLGYESAWSGFGSTVTLCATPTSNTPLNITSGSFTARWGDGGNPSGTRYELWWSTSSSYSTYLSSITTQNELDLTLLIANATYYSQVRALNRAGTPTQWVSLPNVLTKIEEVQGVDFVDVSTGSIRAKVSGVFTSIDEGSSGWLIENITAGTSSQWQSGTPYYWNSNSDPGSGSDFSLKASRLYTFRARTRDRMGNVTPFIEVSTWTRARNPGYDNLSQISTYTIRANWTSNENVSAQYYVECSSKSDFSLIYATGDWSSSVSYLFNTLNPNTRYYFRVKARNTNIEGTDTVWTILPSSYTLIENITNASFASVGITSITIQASSQVSGIDSGLSGIVFKWSPDENFLTGVTSTTFLQQTSTEALNLLPNTTYYFRFISRNGDGTPTDETNNWAKSTLANIPGQPVISNPTGTTFTIGISSNSNSAHTLYAIKAISGQTTYYVTSGKVLSSDSGAQYWDTTDGWGSPFTLTNLVGNTQYTISVRAKNSEGIVTSYSQSATSSTLADVPGQPSLSVISTHSINVVLSEGSNSAETEFAIAVSSDNWATTMFVSSSNYELVGSTQWATKSMWGGVTGRQVATRRPNTKFIFKAVARNKDGIITNWSLTNEKYTRIETPEGLNFETYTSSIIVSASGQFTYEPGEQWVRFKRDSSFAPWSETNQYSWNSLSPNTTYNFYTQTRNKENLENSWVGPFENSTLIELPSGLEYRIYVSSIEVRPTGNFTNLSRGNSGLVVERQGDSGQLLWQNTTNYWWTFVGLDTASAYNFRANSRNGYGIANSSTSWQTRYTLPATPPAPTIQDASASNVSLKINEGDNSGSSNVRYAIALSTSGEFTTVQYATYTGTSYTVSSMPAWLSYDDWGGITGFTLGGLTSNTTYYFASKAINPDNLETPYSAIVSTRTRITTPTSIEFVMLAKSSSTVKGTNPEITSFDPGDSSGINFEVYVDSYVNFHSSSSFIKTNSWTATGLTPNTTYWWKITTRNPDGSLNSSNKVGAQAQRIEELTALTFKVESANAIQVAPIPGDYTELDKGVSGIIIYENSISTSSGWRKTTDYWTLTGLSPDTLYTFSGRSRNRSGLENQLTIPQSTYTLANVPLAPALSPLTTSTINVVINENSNPAATLFAIALSSDNWATTRFVQSDGNINGSETWLTRAGWNGASGVNVINLEANKQYRFKVKARNQSGIETAYSNVSSKYTLIERSTSAVFNSITANQIIISGDPTPSRLTSGNSGILFENQTLGTNSGWKTSNQWQDIGLATNTIYNYVITTKNGDGTANEPSDLIPRATKIEDPSALTADQIGPNSIRLNTTSNSGIFSNLSSGNSGILFYGVNISTDSGWIKQTTWTLTGLAPSTRYVFNVKSRNQDALIESNPLTENVTFYTAPESVGITSLATGNPADTAIWIKISSGTNGYETLYQVALSTTNFESGTTYYIDATLGTPQVVTDTTSATWGTYYVWSVDTGEGKNITELKGNTLYSFKVRAKNPQNLISAWSSVQQRSTNSSAPENLNAIAISSSSINISWTGTGPKYQVERATWNAPTGVAPQTNGWTRIMDWDVSTSTTDTGLSPNKQYYYRVRAGNTDDTGVSNWAGNISRYTLASPPLFVAYSQVLSNKITVDYNNPDNPSNTEYKIQISTDSSFGSFAGDSGWTDSLSSTFTALDPNIRYYTRAQSRNAELSTGSWVNFGSTYTLCVTPEAPVVSTNTTTSLIVSILSDTNSEDLTEYAIKAISGSNTYYVLADRTLGGSPSWQTRTGWGSEITVINLSTNTQYYFSVCAKNGSGIATPFGSNTNRYTLSAAPAFSNYVVHFTSIGVIWTSNGNPSNTQYRVERATSSDFATVITNDEGWADISSTTFTGLNYNKRYYFRLASRNGNNIPSSYTTPSAVYTKIEPAQNLNFDVYWTSMSVQASESFSNLGDGLSKLEFKEYRTSQTSVQTSSTVWLVDGNLSPNTTYGFTIRSYNGDGTANPESTVFIKATRIENPTGLVFKECATDYIKIQPKNEFTSLSEGQSGVIIARTNQTGSSEFETSGYQTSTSTIWTSGGLSPSRIYYYKIKTKNRDGLENNWVTIFSTYTLAQAPAPASPSIVSSGVDYLEINWYEADNSTYTYYMVEGSSVDYGGYPTNSSGWLLNTTYYFLNLIPNTSYYIRVKAKNPANIETTWTQLGSGWTKIEPVTGISFSQGIFQTSATISATGGPFTRINAGGLSGIYFDIFKDEFYSSRHSSTPYISQSSWTVTGLTPNTTYYFRSNSRSGSGQENTPVGSTDEPISAITLIEKAAGIKFGNITNTSIQVAPDGIFTNLSSTGSGVITYSLTTSSSSGWRNSTDYFTITQLSPNTLYSFKSNSRNRQGIESGETPVISTYTLASNPLASVFTNISTCTIRASWTAGLPQNPENTEYYVEASSVSPSGPYNYHDGWQTNIYRDFENLTPNTKYYFRVKSRNFAGVESPWVDLGSKYTLIETVENAIYTVYYTSITITATPQPTGLNRGNSGIIFANETTGVNSGWITNVNYTFANLTQNSTYAFSVNTKNGDGIDNTPYNLPLSCTLVNAATGVAFNNLTPTTIEAKALGEFPPNLGAGLSAIALEAHNSDLDYSSFTWIPSTDWRTFVNLSTNTAYQFRANTRNQLGVTASSSSWITRYTMAAEPGAVSVTTTTQPTSLKIISVGANSNPADTEFSIAISTSPLWSTTSYVQSDGSIGSSPNWSTFASGWASNLTVQGLMPDTTYYFKAVARNGDNLLSSYSAITSKATRSEVPVITSVQPHPTEGNQKLIISWTGKGSVYRVYQATYSATNENDRTLLLDWSASTWTTHQSLSPNKRYYYWVKSRNLEGVESDFSDETSGWTLASQPGQVNPYYSSITQDSMKVSWTSGNPSNPDGTTYKIERATTSDFSGTISWLSTQSTYYYYDQTLAPNRRYFFRVSARNDAGVWTDPVILNQPQSGRATLIESPTGISVSTITTTTIIISADGDFYNLTNPDAGNNSGINFKYSPDGGLQENLRGYSQQNYWEIQGLTPNTTYTFSAVTKNWDGTANSWIPYTSTTATRIESPTGIEFTVSTMTIQARPVFASGPTNLTIDQSGIKLVRGTSILPDDDIEYIQSASSWRLFSGLNPNTLYTFQSRTRNRTGLVNDWVTGFSTYTLCVVPSTPTVQDNPEDHTPPYGTHFVRVVVNSDNPTGEGKTNFAVYNINENKYLDGQGGTQVSVFWSTATVWYHYNLNANTTYQYKVKARNNSGIETVFSSTGSATTGPGAVTWITCTENTTVVEGELYRLKWDWSDVGGANYYELWISTDGSYYEQKAGFTTELTTSYYADHYPDKPNQRYWAKARGKQSGTSGYGGWSPSTSTYTDIERAQYVEFSVVSSTQIAMKARSIVNGNPSGFSRISEGISGISYWCSTSPAVGPTVFVSSVSWTKTTDYYLVPVSLTPNTTYYFKAQSRNALGVETAISGIADSTATWAATPSTPTLVVATSETIKVAVSPGANPAHTLFAIYMDNPINRYVDSSGNPTSVTPVWRTYSDWGGSNGITITGLVKSTEYKVKTRAQSVGGLLTDWSGTLTAYTLGGQPIIENTSPGTQSPSWTNVSVWKFRATNSDSYRWVWNKIPDTSVSADSSSPWDGTTEITCNITSEGNWYFHVGGFSGDPASKTGQTTYGPIKYDNTPPELGSVSCQKSASDPTAIASGDWTREDTPYFYWTEPYSGGSAESPIAGYSVSFSQDENVTPDTTIDTTNTYYEIVTPITEGGIWYFKVRAKDSAGNWSNIQSFTYKFNSGTDRPKVASINPQGRQINGEWVGVGVSNTIIITFDRAMDKDTTEKSVELYAIRDKNGNTIFANISGSALYNSQTYQVVFTPSAPLLKNYTYKIIVTATAKDAMGNNLSSASELTFKTVLDTELSNTVIAPDEKTRVEVDATAVPQTSGGFYIVINVNPSSAPIVTDSALITEAVSRPASANDKFSKIIPSTIREFVAYDVSGNQIKTFDADVTITIPYPDVDRDGIVDGSSPKVQAKCLKIAYLNESTKEWEELKSTVDADKRTVSARTRHFSVYAIKGAANKDVSQAYGYPVPFDASKGDTEIKFGVTPQATLPSNCKIRIYTISGALVTTLEPDEGAPEAVWNLKNSEGQPVASGVYIYVIDNTEGARKTGKLMIIR